MPRHPPQNYRTFQVRRKIIEDQKRELILGESTKEALRRNFKHKEGNSDYFICEIEITDGVSLKVEGSEEMI